MSVPDCPRCKNKPCRHSTYLCFDEDYVANLDDFVDDRDLYLRIWRCYNHPSERSALGLDDPKYQGSLDRCQRIVDKREKIDTEIQANIFQSFRAIGYTGPDLTDIPTPDLEEENRKWREGLKCATKKRDDLGKGNSDTVNGQ